MARMTDTELKLWKDRLTAADRYWESEGLCGSPEAGVLAAQTVFDAYAGRQWGLLGWGGLRPEELCTVNVLFSTMNSLIAQVSARNARPVVKPKGQTMASEEAARKALKNEILLTAVAAEMKVKREVDLAISCAVQAPMGIVEHVYIPRAEKYDADGNLLQMDDTARPDFPSVKFRRLRDVRIDPMASSPYPDGDARWVAFRDLYLLDEVKMNPGFVNRDDLRATVSMEWTDAQPDSIKNNTGPDWAKLVEVWKVYDKVERKWFCLSPGCEKPLRDPADWPIGWESLPFDVIFFHPHVNQMMPISPASQIVSLQMELNKCRTMMAALTKRLRRTVLGSKENFQDGEWEKMTGDAELMEWFAINANVDIDKCVKEIQIGGFPQELLMYHARILEDIREIVGVSQMDRAQRINVETAAEANGVLSGAATMRSPKQERVEDFWSSIYRKLHRGIQQTQDDSVFVPIFEGTDSRILGETAGDYAEVTPEDILGEFDYGVQAGSTLPEDPMQELQKATALFQLFKDDALIEQREIRRRVLEAARMDPQRLLNTTPEQQGATMGDMAAVGVGRDLAKPGVPGEGGAGKGNGAEGAIDPNLLKSIAGGMQ